MVKRYRGNFRTWSFHCELWLWYGERMYVCMEYVYREVCIKARITLAPGVLLESLYGGGVIRARKKVGYILLHLLLSVDTKEGVYSLSVFLWNIVMMFKSLMSSVFSIGYVSFMKESTSL